MTRILVVSPHLDDAVLSVGGRIFDLAAEGAETTVFTMFAGSPQPPFSPVADYLHALWELGEDPVAARRAEDRAALALLGAAPLYGDFHDAVYRRGPDGQWLIGPDGLPTSHGEDDEPELSARLAARVGELLESVQPDLVLTCAAVGDHVDHRRCRNAVLTAAAGQVEIRCWEDLPYGHRTERRPELPGRLRLADEAPVVAGDAAWAAKYRAIDCYASQHVMLWPTEEDPRPGFDAHAQRRACAGALSGRAELFWTVEAAPAGA